jgi:hypothetical protein
LLPPEKLAALAAATPYATARDCSPLESNDVEIYVEGVELDKEGAEQPLAAGAIEEKTKVEFEKLVDVVRQVADKTADGLATLKSKPSEISLEFELTLGVEGGFELQLQAEAWPQDPTGHRSRPGRSATRC